jgi:thiamine-phosphate pyrophosphorylase
MLPEVTPAVARAIAAAAGYASVDRSSVLDTAHVLHGLLAEEEGRAFLGAVAAGLDAVAYRNTVPPAVASSAGESSPLAPRTRDALKLARSLAREHAGEEAVSGDILLVALLRSDDTLKQAVEGLGLNLGRLEAAVLPAPGPPLELQEPLNLAGSVANAGLARLLDAAANRAREGLRVTEDYCRFVLDDALLCGELKALRHDLAAVLAELPAGTLLAARDTLGDVGAGLSTAAEGERASPLAVAQANLKRLQEALRSLEEFGKLHGRDFGRSLEALRYRSYTLEKSILASIPAREQLRDARLYLLVTGARCLGSLERTVAEAAAGGVEIVQLREKGLSDRDLLDRARQVRRWTRQAGVLFVVNDRPDIARLAEADGVHLGQNDLPVREARSMLGPDALIGVSTHDLAQLRQAVLDGAGYVGIGPTFASGTKDFTELAGLEYIRSATAATSLPAFVIGGVNVANVGEVIAAGGRRVAVSQTILQAESPRAIAVELRRRLASGESGDGNAPAIT